MVRFRFLSRRLAFHRFALLAAFTGLLSLPSIPGFFFSAINRAASEKESNRSEHESQSELFAKLRTIKRPPKPQYCRKVIEALGSQIEFKVVSQLSTALSASCLLHFVDGQRGPMRC